MQTKPAPQIVRCMHGGAATGGLAAVYWLPDAPPGAIAAAAASIIADSSVPADTTVFVTVSEGRYIAESYSAAGARIRFCGHGSLAAAWVVFNEHAPDVAALEFVNADRSWQARLTADADTEVALRYPKPTPVACIVPEFAEACLGDYPVAAAEVGTSSDYLILEFADADAVRQLKPDFAAMGVATQRALIVTADAKRGGSPACVFRYFAPQYGNPEDAATGSAAVQLAAYWSSRLDTEQLNAQQLSPQGACMRLGCHAATVDLAARVAYL